MPPATAIVAFARPPIMRKTRADRVKAEADSGQSDDLSKSVAVTRWYIAPPNWLDKPIRPRFNSARFSTYGRTIAMPSQWFVRGNGQVFGPLDDRHLVKLAADGKIDANTEVARNQHGPWSAAGRVKGLQFPRAATQATATAAAAPPPPPPKAARVIDAELEQQPTHREEFSKDRRRFIAAISGEADKFAIVQPYLMEYEEPVAIAVQRKFPFSIFSDIVLLSSHRLMLFKRFFNKIDMFDVNYVDIQNVKVQQGFFTSAISAVCADGRKCVISRLVTDQALKIYRLCQDIETKARIARRQFQLEENRSRTTQMNVNNVISGPAGAGQSQMPATGPALPYQQDIAQIGREQTDPYRLGE